MIRLPLRYLAMHSTGPDDNVEANIAPIDEVYEIDRSAAALVLVDCWNKHPIKSHAERSATIVEARIAPLLPLARAAGLPVIHAPSPDVAPRYERYRSRFGEYRPRPPAAQEWPPPELRARSGPYERYRKVPGETPPNGAQVPHWDAIDPALEPTPQDSVVATGDELHELLAERRILFLFYAGFAANICVPHRDYGILAMGARGYLPVLLRDCTTAIETRATLADFRTTQLAVQDVERRYYSADSRDLGAALTRD